jgi:hypothetical protein
MNEVKIVGRKLLKSEFLHSQNCRTETIVWSLPSGGRRSIPFPGRLERMNGRGAHSVVATFHRCVIVEKITQKWEKRKCTILSFPQ